MAISYKKAQPNNILLVIGVKCDRQKDPEKR